MRAVEAAAPITGEAPQTIQAVNTNLLADVPEVPASAALQHSVLQTSTLHSDTTRPWPRAVLPQLNGGGALSADYATGPSFYPFSAGPVLEPANDDTAPARAAANR